MPRLLTEAANPMLKMVSTIVVGFLFSAFQTTHAQPFLIENTYYVSIVQRTQLSETASNLGAGGYELADGKYVSFMKWYQPQWIDLQFNFMTQLTPNFGILWGVSTGDWGEKYVIRPSFRAGVIVQRPLSLQSTISLSATYLFGGRLVEKACVADYGDVGGIQAVNCRLAAAPIAPSETLQYLINVRPSDWGWVMLRYNLKF